jgi:hypothetical protein
MQKKLANNIKGEKMFFCIFLNMVILIGRLGYNRPNVEQKG